MICGSACTSILTESYSWQVNCDRKEGVRETSRIEDILSKYRRVRPDALCGWNLDGLFAG